MSPVSRLLAFALATGLLAGAVACGGGSSGDPAETPGRTTPIATPANVPNESGEAPIFWRTADDFQSVVAGQPYTVLFRITDGYDEAALTVQAVCRSCAGGRQTVTFEGLNSPPFPPGSDLPGSYYPMNLVLPIADRWYLTVQVGTDEVTIPINVKAVR